MQDGPKFPVAATFEKANTYGFAEKVIHSPNAGLTCVLPAFAFLKVTGSVMITRHEP